MGQVGAEANLRLGQGGRGRESPPVAHDGGEQRLGPVDAVLVAKREHVVVLGGIAPPDLLAPGRGHLRR